MNKLTKEQAAAIAVRGKAIVSASAGSGKTFVMIEKLVSAVASGLRLENVLAVTFTNKAAAQMKDKLRSALIAKIGGADDEVKARLKGELKKVASADISTIHAMCARLLRRYFYLVGVDAGFSMVVSDSALKELKRRALDNVFEECYEEKSEGFLKLLSCYVKKQSDSALRGLVLDAHRAVRVVGHYERELEKTQNLYDESGFDTVVKSYENFYKNSVKRLISAVELFKNDFSTLSGSEKYLPILDEMSASLCACTALDVFDEKPTLYVSKKPVAKGDAAIIDGEFKRFRDYIKKKYAALNADFKSRKDELEAFLKSGEVAKPFSELVLKFDREYFSIKRDENKLDPNDLEHLTLSLLENETVLSELNEKYKFVFVDEYQDVNPVQEEIISAIGGDVFLVGDVKQAIYGFRGSKSLFFSDTFKRMQSGEGSALRLSNNFRSADGVLNFVNALFSEAMTEELCGFDYSKNSQMIGGGKYPEGYGKAEIHLFGEDEKEERGELCVYSVTGDKRKRNHTREGLAVLALIEKLLEGEHYSVEEGKLVKTQCGDICILSRKKKTKSITGIVEVLRDRGYKVSCEQDANACEYSEVKTFLDILSLIDNAEQDLPLVAAMLSPLGGFTEDELARIRIAAADNKSTFRECCAKYKYSGEIFDKLRKFYARLKKLRAFADVLTTGALADELLETYGLEIAFNRNRDGVKNVLRVVDEGADLPLSEFLKKLKESDFSVPSATSSLSDSIKVMSMHAAKGLEFPIVIIADICSSYRGDDNESIYYNEEFGFAPKTYDPETMTTGGTVLRYLTKAKNKSEEVKNELNLFYVACTRAMCELHIFAKEIKEFDAAAIADAKCYAEMFDLKKFGATPIEGHGEFSAAFDAAAEAAADERLIAALDSSFLVEYPFKESVDLPVKSSASAILHSRDGEKYESERQLFSGEGETDTARGTAYHRFLELCDFDKKESAEIAEEIESFVKSGRMDAEAASLLDCAHIADILSMPVFSGLDCAVQWREREFLCRLPACEILDGVTAKDEILVQGAIDLVAQGDFGFKIVDYKYSKKDGDALRRDYAAQLKLYRKALAKINRVDEKNIKLSIVNLYKKFSIELD